MTMKLLQPPSVHEDTSIHPGSDRKKLPHCLLGKKDMMENERSENMHFFLGILLICP